MGQLCSRCSERVTGGVKSGTDFRMCADRYAENAIKACSGKKLVDSGLC